MSEWIDEQGNFVRLGRQQTPVIGALRHCLVCAYEKPWGIFDGQTGITVCVDCRNAPHDLRFTNTELATSESRVVDLTARVAQLEDGLRKSNRYLGYVIGLRSANEFTSTVGPHTLAEIEKIHAANKALLESSSPTPGEAWRAMVTALETLCGMVDDEETTEGIVLRVRLARAESRKVLAVARKVMGERG